MYEDNLDILYLNQDMTEFELYGTVDAIICSLDGVNYLTEDGDLLKMLKLVKNYLNPGGIMIFDINSEYKLSTVLGNNTFVTEEKDIFYVWQNEYDEKSKICYFNLDFFEKNGNTYKRYTEEQAERAYSEAEIRGYAESAGLDVCGFFGEFGFESPTEKTRLICTQALPFLRELCYIEYKRISAVLYVRIAMTKGLKMLCA